MSVVEIIASFALMNPSVPPIEVDLPEHQALTVPRKESWMQLDHPATRDAIMLSLQKDSFIKRFAVIEQDFDIAFQA